MPEYEMRVDIHFEKHLYPEGNHFEASVTYHGEKSSLYPEGRKVTQEYESYENEEIIYQHVADDIKSYMRKPDDFISSAIKAGPDRLRALQEIEDDIHRMKSRAIEYAGWSENLEKRVKALGIEKENILAEMRKDESTSS